ncbi:Poly(ADP-ribose) glycohydrolase 1 [Caenorhabditis elegans]|uniref:Poly(ADP-ribose) glycohydrolase 1 n=1 Tax=Caenorhabditis elegans TaxID=6239 RepID=PARG1_CAEEL|nr:Poly(ADP-ribose) glycohydrolase 1 [Caenorhabditis elegans]Q867X0.1 RecName: Full=Poly(ADP-ribose) glycohydrolase 1; AltName: Full=Poly ADP-ribose metabolism enzyme 3 [Caenorhabditis elegans]AAO26316.1 poly ADP-ribose metabolism enzyme-3 long form [Caenorhabditis elegans]CAD89735.1 Poly(ADP-ribose) glycohydrolase 1 [Caenorhabditis elegans]|eukprot:NP_001023135.1 Poly(ADP-ribose) glycohydrolase 1 [Caenorhabditis elegans]
MSKKFIELGDPVTQDEKDYEDYVGVGFAHQVPTMKRRKLTEHGNTTESKEDPEEPKSRDVFVSSQSSDESQEDSAENPEIAKEVSENCENLTETLKISNIESLDNVTERSEHTLDNHKSTEPMEEDVNNKSNIDVAINSDEDDELVLEENNKEMRDGEQVQQDLFADDQELIEYPGIMKDTTTQLDITDSEVETAQKMEMIEETEADSTFVGEDSKNQRQSGTTSDEVDADSQINLATKTVRTSSSSFLSTVSTCEAPAKGRARMYQKELEKHVIAFTEGNLTLQPDLNKVDPDRNYRYCTIPNFPASQGKLREDNRYGPKIVLPQRWREFDSRGRRRDSYFYFKRKLDGYLKCYKTTGYFMFVGLLHNMWEFDPDITYKLPALEMYYKEMSELVGREEVLEKFARVARIAKTAEDILPERIYRLVGDVESATLSHKQCAALVARMFFARPDSPFSFCRILSSDKSICVEKLKFLFTYFDKMSMDPPDGAVSFRLTKMDKDTFNEEWKDKKLRSLPEVEFFDEMLIEDTALCTQVDFANEHLGGGVLNHGSVQEEIRFLMCPEMMVGMLLCEKMKQLEAISIVGAYVFSSYTGYGHTLKWAELQPNHSRQNTNEFRDRFGRLRVETIAIDAILFKGSKLDCQTEQLNKANIIREMKKASIGFMSQGPKFTNIPIVTGWWGCGAFNGDKPLKFIIQVIAAGVADRPLHFCSFGEPELAAKCKKIIERMKQKDVTLGMLFSMINNTGLPHKHFEFYVFDRISTYLSSSEDVESSKSSPSVSRA